MKDSVKVTKRKGRIQSIRFSGSFAMEAFKALGGNLPSDKKPIAMEASAHSLNPQPAPNPLPTTDRAT